MSYRIGEGSYLDEELKRRTRVTHEQIARASAGELDGPAFVATLCRELPVPVTLRLNEEARDLADADVVMAGFDGPRTVRGERMTVAIPVRGSIDLLPLRPTTSLFGKRFAGLIESRYMVLDGVSVDCIVWTYDEAPTVDPDRFKSWWDRDLGMVQTQIGYSNADIERFVASWDADVEARIAARREHLEDQARRRQALGA